MQSVMYEQDAVAELINTGEALLIGADESLLGSLPGGNWIGGTTPYFMTDKGGLMTRRQAYVVRLGDLGATVSIRCYDQRTVGQVYRDGPDNGFSVMIIPAASATHQRFAVEAPNFAGFASRPLIGWIAGVHLDDIGKVGARVRDGSAGSVLDEDAAVVMHVALPRTKVADVGIVNIFEPGDGDTITFDEPGFVQKAAVINGERTSLAAYCARAKLDTRLPLVADYCGAMINTSFQSVDGDKDEVHFYAPVFGGVTYRLARPVKDYIGAFSERMPGDAHAVVFSCNCILNYLYCELEGRQTGDVTGPITFGEIAYQLVNQTLAYLTIHDA